MAEDPMIEGLLRDVKFLRGEIAGLRKEMAELKGSGTGVPAPPARAAAAVLPLTTAEPGYHPPLPPPPAPKEIKPSILSRLAAKDAKSAPRLPKVFKSAEQYIGQNILQYIGVALLAIGAAFFLIWRSMYTTPIEKVTYAAAAGAAMILWGGYIRKSVVYARLSAGLTAGGWAIIFITTYAAHYVSATQVINSPDAAFKLLALAAVGMIAHSLYLEARRFRLFSFGLTYLVFFIVRADVPDPKVFLFLHIASSVIAVYAGYADVLLVSLAGFYLNSIPSCSGALAGPRSPGAFADVMFLLTAGYFSTASLPWFRGTKAILASDTEAKTLDTALSFNAVIFGVIAYSFTWAYFDKGAAARYAGLTALFLAATGFSYLRTLGKDFSATYVLPIAGLCVAAGGILCIEAPMLKMFAWIGVSSLWVWIGLRMNHAAWRISGFAMAIITFIFYISVASMSEAYRRSAGSAMFVFSGISYLLSRFYRLWLKGNISKDEESIKEFWLYMGSAALMIGLWSFLDPAPFAVSLVILTLAGEYAAQRFGRAHLWIQAGILQVGTAVYACFIDYGANTPMAWILSPRLLTVSCITAGLYYIYHANIITRELAEKCSAWTLEGQRAALSWAAAACAAFAIYNEFNPRMRLPFWALGSVALYLAGQRRADKNLKLQAIMLSLVTATEALISYYLTPAAGLSPITPTETIVYWGSTLTLMLTFVLASDKRSAHDSLDVKAAELMPTVTMTLAGAYLAKEFSSYALTMAWGVEGLMFLVAGIMLDFVSMRYPALGLLGICVIKVIIYDTTGLPLPYRVVTFTLLGAILLLASMLYMKTSKHEKNNTADPV